MLLRILIIDFNELEFALKKDHERHKIKLEIPVLKWKR